MKVSLIVLSILALNLTAFAEGKEGDHFQEHKTQMLKMMNERKAMIDSAIACINAAQNHEAIQKCHQQEMDMHKKMESDQIQERKKHLQDEMNKLNEQEAAHKKN